jgi:hypothetical protein
MHMPDVLIASTICFIIFGWAISAGYKDWLMDRRKREKLLASQKQAHSKDSDQ